MSTPRYIVFPLFEKKRIADSWKSESCEANLTVFGHDTSLEVLSLFLFLFLFVFVLFGIILRLELLLSLKALYRLSSPECERYA